MIHRMGCVRYRLLGRKFVIRAPGGPASETWRDATWSDRNNARQVGGGERNQAMLAFGQAVAIACR